MKYNLTNKSPEHELSDCLIIGVYKGKKLTSSATKIDSASHGYIKKILSRGDLEGDIDQVLVLQDVPNLIAKRVLLVGCGEKGKINASNYARLLTAAMTNLRTIKCKHVSSYLTDLELNNQDIHWQIRQNIIAISNSQYYFDRFKTVADDYRPTLNKFSIYRPDTSDHRQAQQVMAEAIAMTAGIQLCKDLANLPSNVCTPTFLANEAKKLAKASKQFRATVVEESAMRKLGMNTLLAVSQGSDEPAKLITIHYQGGKKGAKPIALVGKGITFDSGGLWLKPPQSMIDMKYDMCGAATVLGTLKAISELALPINVVGVIAAAENMPGGTAIKPGDIVTTLSGQTVEIINTDAEGRLVLCDALSYCQKFQPTEIIDIATLTGGVVVALGSFATAVLANDDKMITDLQTAGEEAHDRVWPLPLWDEYQESLTSNFADMANVSSDRSAQSIVAASFLARFTKKQRWAHLDIAATGHIGGKERGATGRPVPLLVRYLANKHI